MNVMSEIWNKISNFINDPQYLQRKIWLGRSGRTVSLTLLLGILVYTTNLVGWDWLKTHDKPWGHLLFLAFLVSGCSCGNLLMGCICETGKKTCPGCTVVRLPLHLQRKSEQRKPPVRLLPYIGAEQKVQRNHHKEFPFPQAAFVIAQGFWYSLQEISA